jgi:hypothetical protein
MLKRYGTPREQAVWNHALEAEKQYRFTVVRKLVANIENDRERQTLGNKLMKRPLGELKELLSLIPQQQPVANSVSDPMQQEPSFFGAASPVSNSLGESGSDDILPLPVMNFSNEKAKTGS